MARVVGYKLEHNLDGLVMSLCLVGGPHGR
jgi:hypothetical protein